MGTMRTYMKQVKSKLMKELGEFSKIKRSIKKESIFLKECLSLKEYFVKNNRQEEAKDIWVLEHIYIAQNKFLSFVKLIRKEKYYDAWGQLERCEIELLNLDKHIPKEYVVNTYFDFLKYQVPRWQKIFPYKIFASSEFLEKEIRCSICDAIITPRRFCGHIKGEIYNGEMCFRIITKADLIGVAMVKNPVNKFCVLFKQNENGDRYDHYDYKVVKFLVNTLPSLFYWWDLNESVDLHPRSEFLLNRADDFCPCDSEKKFIDCCYYKEIITTPHIEIIPIRKI